MLQPIDVAHLEALRPHLKGKRLERLEESVRLINESVAAGGWVPKASQRARAGFKDMPSAVRSVPTPHPRTEESEALWRAHMAIRHGSVPSGAHHKLSDEALQALAPKVPVAALRAYCELRDEAYKACTLLDALRPLPKVTPIGLSPRVTATLTECGLDVDLASIKPTEIGVRWVQARYTTMEKYDSKLRRRVKVDHPRKGELRFTPQGEPVMAPVYFLKWTPGTVFGRSRFSHSDCEACGKRIPSGRFVAIEADCKINGHIGLYLGCDCAANIFGVKDQGLPKEPQEG